MTSETSAVRAAELPTLSGLDGDQGRPSDPCIAATSTLTLALPKAGLLEQQAAPWVGDLYVADIPVPALVYDRIGVRVDPIFSRHDVVAVR